MESCFRSPSPNALLRDHWVNCFGIKVQPLVCIETKKWKQILRTAEPSGVLGNSIAGSSISFCSGAAGSALELSVFLTSRDMELLRHELLALIEVVQLV